MKEVNGLDDLARLAKIEIQLQRRHAPRIVSVRKLSASPWPGLAGTVSLDLTQFAHELMAPLFQRRGTIAPDIPDAGPNLASSLAHLWDSAPGELVLEEETILDLPKDKDSNLHGGLLGAAGIRLKCLAKEEDVDGERICVVHFDPDRELPPVTPQMLDQIKRRLPTLMGPLGAFMR